MIERDAGSKGTLLVVDDEQAIRQVIETYFKHLGYTVFTAPNGRAGLEILQNQPVDVVLSDLSMPEIDGKELLHLAKQQNLPAEFIMITAHTTIDTAVEVLRSGAYDFVTKPFVVTHLEGTVRRCLQQKKLREEIKRLENEKLRLVLQAVSEITSSPSLVETLESVLRAVDLLIQPEASAVLLQEEDSENLQVVVNMDHVAAFALTDRWLDQHHRYARQALRERGLVRLEGNAQTPHVLCAPIPLEESLIGAISILRPPGTPPFAEEAPELLNSLAIQAGNAVRNARIYADLQQQSMQLSSLFDVGLAMSSEQSLQSLFQVIVDSAAKVSGAQRCSLMVLDEETQTLRIRAAIGIPEETIARAEVRLGEGIAGHVAQTGEPIFVADIERDDRFARRNDTKYNSKSLVSVPIKVQGQVRGVLNINNKLSGKSFTENDRNLLTLLASHAAVALENAHRYQDLNILAVTDSLTKVYIRRYFEECLARAFRNAQRYKRAFSLVMCDIDHFKQINDTYGHLQGDRTLQIVAEILKANIRDDDLVARYGGEEFVLILDRAETETAVSVAERIRQTVEARPIPSEQGDLHITLSLGVATYRSDIPTAHDLVAAADAALYEAKKSGRNRVCVSP